MIIEVPVPDNFCSRRNLDLPRLPDAEEAAILDDGDSFFDRRRWGGSMNANLLDWIKSQVI